MFSEKLDNELKNNSIKDEVVSNYPIQTPTTSGISSINDRSIEKDIKNKSNAPIMPQQVKVSETSSSSSPPNTKINQNPLKPKSSTLTSQKSNSSSDDYNYASLRSFKSNKASRRLDSIENKENKEKNESSNGTSELMTPEQIENAKRKLSRKNSSLLDKILLNNTENKPDKGDMFYHEPSADYLGIYEFD